MRVAPITRRGQHDKSVGSIRGFFVWNSELRNATMPQLTRMWIIFRQKCGKGGKRLAAIKEFGFSHATVKEIVRAPNGYGALGGSFFT